MPSPKRAFDEYTRDEPDVPMHSGSDQHPLHQERRSALTTTIRVLSTIAAAVFYVTTWVPGRLLRRYSHPAQITALLDRSGKRRAVEMEVPGAYPQTPRRPSPKPVVTAPTPVLPPQPSSLHHLKEEDKRAKDTLDPFVPYWLSKNYANARRAVALDEQWAKRVPPRATLPSQWNIGTGKAKPTPEEVYQKHSEPFFANVVMSQTVDQDLSTLSDAPEEQVIQPGSLELSFLDDAQPPARGNKSVRWKDSVITGLPHDQGKEFIFDQPINFPVHHALPQDQKDMQSPRPPIINVDEDVVATPQKFHNYNDKSPMMQTPPNRASDLTPLQLAFEEFHVTSPQREELEVSDSVRKRRAAEADRLRRIALENEAKKAAEREAKKKAEQEAREKEERTRKEVEQAERKRQEAEAAARLAAQAAAAISIISPLPEEWQETVTASMATKNMGSKLVGELTRHSFGTLLPVKGIDDPSAWVNDDIINTYLDHLVTRANQKARHKKGQGPPPFHAFNSAWYPKVAKEGVGAISRWSKRFKVDGQNLLKCNKILFPINTGSHWTLLVISPKDRTIEYLDSLYNKPQKFVQLGRDWLKMELKNTYNPEDWTEVMRKTPRQANGSDCGVFTCINAVAHIRGLDPMQAYKAADMTLARMQIAATLLDEGFTGDFDWS